jgi:hypothetical protein
MSRSGRLLARESLREMKNQSRTQRLSWDRPLKDVWDEFIEPANDLDAPYCRKLTLLAQLKTAEAVANSTKLLMVLTAVIVLSTAVQTVVAVLTYLHSAAH